MNYDIKQDKDKIRLELVPPSLMWAVGIELELTSGGKP